MLQETEQKRVSVTVNPAQSITNFIGVLLQRPENGKIKDIVLKEDPSTGLVQVSTSAVSREQLKSILNRLGHEVLDFEL